MSSKERSIFNAVRGMNVRYNYWPTLPGTGVGGVVLTSGAGAWGDWKDLAAANAIATPYWVCGIAVYTPNAIQVWQLGLGTAAGAALLAQFMSDVTALTVNLVPMLVLVPIYRPANAATTGRAGGAAAKTINAHLIFATGL